MKKYSKRVVLVEGTKRTYRIEKLDYWTGELIPKKFKRPEVSFFKKALIYRWNPESTLTNKTKIDAIYFNPNSLTGSMVLDTLIHIKQNGLRTLAFRRSCREGICGSCAMNIDGVNTLACIEKNPWISDKTIDTVAISPLPHMFVLKDLVVDLTHFYKQYKSIRPWVIPRKKHIKEREFLQSKKERSLLDGYYECILCACCSTSCPSYWWNPEKYLGPAHILQSYRWILDSRSGDAKERISFLTDKYKVMRCHGILNCTRACPKHLNPAKAIAEVKSRITAL